MRRSGALALVALCLYGQLAGLAHVTIVAHVTCAEHGEQVHAVQEPGSRAAGSWYGANAAADGEHADHCAIATFNASAATLTTPTSQPAPAHRPVPVARSPFHAPPSSPLVYAPKTSPPVS